MRKNLRKIKPFSLNDIIIRNIKEDLINLKEKYFNKLIEYPFTEVFKEKVYDDFYEWVEYWNLYEFRFKLIFNENQIIFKPIRDIDKYLIIGIMNL